MATVVSVDLARKHFKDIGVALLTDEGQGIRIEFTHLPNHGMPGPRDAQTLASDLTDLVRSHGASILMIDGPQAWKDPNNGIAHMRMCERELRTPAKTGLPGQVKPATWTPFVSFSIDVFDALRSAGHELLAEHEARIATGKILVLEVFPTSAWKGLGIKPALPAKARSTRDDLIRCLALLRERYSLDVQREPTHDELQALVSGLAGIAIARQSVAEYSVHGEPPKLVGGIWREGFIVNPRQAPCTGPYATDRGIST